MQMIEKLKKKIVIIATIATFALMAFLLVIINTINYSAVVSEADKVLDMLSRPGESFFADEDRPDGNRGPGDRNRPENEHQTPTGEKREGKKPETSREDGSRMPRGMSPEVPYESRFFTVLVDDNGELVESDVSRIVSVDSDSVKEYLNEALNSSGDKGFVNSFRYKKIAEDGMTRIMFLDCGRKLNAFYRFMWVSIAIGLFGCLIVFIIMIFVSRQLVKPIAESYERQKRFITDAGHEMKTPITIISVNTDLLEDEIGENESIKDIRLQTKRLTALTNELVYLSRIEETENKIQKKEFTISDIVNETASEFAPSADAGNINYEYTVEPDIRIKGSDEMMRRLISILLDNAIKYTPQNGRINLNLNYDKKTVVLKIVNTVDEDIPEEDIKHLFERFYRTDESRNSETGGHGLGLSIANAIVDAHGGKITAACNNKEFEINVILAQ